MSKILDIDSERIKTFSLEVLAVVDSATAFAKERHYSDVGREHLLFGFANGAGGEVIARALELSGLSKEAVLSAIEYFDGPRRPVRPHHVKYVHYIQEKNLPNVLGFLNLSARQLFPQLTPNADVVFKMALAEADDSHEVGVQEVLRTFLREIGRSDDNRRIMQVIHHVVPDLALGDIKDIAVNAQEALVTSLRHQRHDLVFELGTAASPKVDEQDRIINEQANMLTALKQLRWSLIRQPSAVQV